jgi:TRAP-type uncharacterized transport system fused permease subunit
MADNTTPADSLGGISEEARKRVEELIEEEEGAHNRYRGWLAVFMTMGAVVMSLFHLYSAVEIVPAYILRPIHVAFALALVFLMFPTAKRFRHRLMWWDVIFAILSVAVVAYMLYFGDEFGDRAVTAAARPGSCRSSCCCFWPMHYLALTFRNRGHTRAMTLLA